MSDDITESRLLSDTLTTEHDLMLKVTHAIFVGKGPGEVSRVGVRTQGKVNNGLITDQGKRAPQDVSV